jgi:hypothetical protein
MELSICFGIVGVGYLIHPVFPDPDLLRKPILCQQN